MNAVIDTHGINREVFNVSERGDFLLITPKKNKHVWEESELHLRSLLVRRNGEVVSSGFGKFRNYGENRADDERFRNALSRGDVAFVEKLDGSLIIVDRIDGNVHLRTRGNHFLGDFEGPVLRLIAAKYPHFLSACNNDALDRLSLLLEYTAPDNRIVLRYEEPELTLLGAMDKSTLQPLLDEVTLGSLAHSLGVERPSHYDLPEDFNALMEFVKGWSDREGVVAHFFEEGSGRPSLLKIKATQYVRLHSVRFGLEGKVGKLLFLLGVTTLAEAEAILESMGVDYEAQTFLGAEIEQYIGTYAELRGRFIPFVNLCSYTTNNCRTHMPTEREARKEYVNTIRNWLGCSSRYTPDWFTAAMCIYNLQEAEAWLNVVCRFILNESVNTVKVWASNPHLELATMLETPSVQD
jgi:hypothetical protein